MRGSEMIMKEIGSRHGTMIFTDKEKERFKRERNDIHKAFAFPSR